MGVKEPFRTVGWWVRIRDGLELAGLGAVGCLLVGIGLKAFGGKLTPLAWLVVPVLFLLGGARPRDWERAYLNAGRRLGIGGRLAAARLLHVRGERALYGLLVAEISARRAKAWRLLCGRLEATGVVLLLGLCALFVFIPAPPSNPALPPPEEAQGEEAKSPPVEDEVQGALAPPARLYLEGDASARLPFQELLAQVYGLTQASGPWAEPRDFEGQVAAQQGLLRRLAQQLAELSPGGLSQEEQQALLPLAQEVARKDLQEDLLRLIKRGDEQAAEEAAEAIQAVRKAGEELAQDAQGFLPEGAQAEAAPSSEGAGGGQVVPSGASDIPGTGELAAERGEQPGKEGELAGLEAGEEIPEAGPPAERRPSAREVAPSLNPGEGPMRGYITAGVPVESGGAMPEGGLAFSPGRAELILRGRGVPVELRGVVRSYFEIVTQGDSR